MIEFLSFFLVLTTGQMPVELAVAGPVAAVELRLDGRTVGTLRGEPWSTLCDLGPELAPRELVAIARDAAGRELDRAVQWINVGTQSSGATMSFETDPEGRPRAVGLEWESIGRRRPQAIEVAFDGEPLDASDPKRVELPPYDANSLHFVAAVVRFSDRLVTRIDAGFGGVYTETVASELTAVPVTLEKRGRTPRREKLRSLFVKDGEPVRVHGVEKTDAELIVVRDPASESYFGRMTEGALRARPTFDDDTRLFFLTPRPTRMLPEVVASEVFPHSRRYPAAEDGLLYLTQRQPPLTFPVHLADAVAVAGMTAQASHRRRAVVLVLGGAPADESRYSPDQVREYLRRLRVPFYVWSMLSGAPPTAWGDTRFVGSGGDLAEAVAEVRRDLAAQRIVWLEGRHLPQAVELADEDEGLRLAVAPRAVEPPRVMPPPAEPPRAGFPSTPPPATESAEVRWAHVEDDEERMVELFSQRDGLVEGSHPVELVVVGPVAEVEVRLDERAVGTVSAEPWALDVDLGEGVAPHRLTVLARDRQGRELERTERWLNVVTPAEDLTAVAVTVDRGVDLPGPGAMATWFVADGKPVRVEKLESGAAEVAIVRDPLIQPRLEALAAGFLDFILSPSDKAQLGRRLSARGSPFQTLAADGLTEAQIRAAHRAMRRLRSATTALGAGVDVGFISPMAAPVSAVESERNLYNRSGPYTAADGDFIDLAANITVGTAHRLSDAVAVAAMELHGTGERRAVVALVGAERGDESFFTPAQVRAYLRALQVPLFVWSAAPSPPGPHPEWGAVRWVYSRHQKRWPNNFEDAAAELRRHLASQRIVYLAGRHLPQAIALTEDAVGLRLAGAGELEEGGAP